MHYNYYVFKDLKKHYYLAGVALASIFVHFSSSFPAIFFYDSVKYSAPLQVIRANLFQWILDTINFSLFYRIVAYFSQGDNGALSNLISINKWCSVISTILVFKLSQKLGLKHWQSALVALIFSLNPQLLFYEQAVMPDSFFVMATLIVSYCLYFVITTKKLWISGLAGFLIGISAFIKETAGPWLVAISAVLIIVSLYDLIKSKQAKTLISTAVLILAANFASIPLKLYNLNKHSQFVTSRYVTNTVIIWSLTEDMIRESKSKHQWLKDLIIRIIEDKRLEKFGDRQAQEKDFVTLHYAISQINVAGREGQLIIPGSSTKLSPQEWQKTVYSFWLDSVFTDKWLGNLNSILSVSANSMFWHKPVSLWTYRDSAQRNVRYEFLSQTKIPFSLTQQMDPELKDCKLISMQGFKPEALAAKNSAFNKMAATMINGNDPRAFLCPTKGLSMWVQKSFGGFNHNLITLPLFLLSILLAIFKWKNLDLFKLFILGSALFFSLFPLFIHGEPRYCLQYFHFVILFIAAIGFNFSSTQK